MQTSISLLGITTTTVLVNGSFNANPPWMDTGSPEFSAIAGTYGASPVQFRWMENNGVFYPFYEHPVKRWGISALSDQGIAGGLMMIEGSLVTIAAIAWLFLRLASEGELRQRLIEEGADPAAVARAVRYGRGEELAGSR